MAGTSTGQWKESAVMAEPEVRMSVNGNTATSAALKNH